MSSTLRSSCLSRLSIMLYVRRKRLCNRVGRPVLMRRRVASGGMESASLHNTNTVPWLSLPLLPARPAICVYSPGREISELRGGARAKRRHSTHAAKSEREDSTRGRSRSV